MVFLVATKGFKLTQLNGNHNEEDHYHYRYLYILDITTTMATLY